MKSKLITVHDHGKVYQSLAFWCPGCDMNGRGGLHMLPVNTGGVKSPSWDFDGNLELPTLSPSILTRSEFRFSRGETEPFVCHSFLKAGVFEFLGDCTHRYANQRVPIPDLPEWFVRDTTKVDDDDRDLDNGPEEDEV